MLVTGFCYPELLLSVLFIYFGSENIIETLLAAVTNKTLKEDKSPLTWPPFLCLQLADQFCNAIGVLQQCGPPASFSNIQTAINKDQPANPTEGK